MQLLVRSATSLQALRSCFAPLRSFHLSPMLANQSPDRMVDDMITYVRTGCQGNTQQAVDILKTGLAHQTGVGHTRLQLAMSEIQSVNCNWAAVIEHTLPVAEQQVVSDSPLAAKMQMEASLVCVRALLTTGRDADAVHLAQQAAKQVKSWFAEGAQLQLRQQAGLEASTSLLGALHATGDFQAAASLEKSLMDSVSRRPPEPEASVPDASMTAARAQAMALRLATMQQNPSEEPAAEQDESAHVPSIHKPAEQSSSDLRPAHWQQACAAQYLVMEAQAAAAQQEWNTAEEQLSKALNLAEQLNAGNSQTPVVGLVLGMLGHTYARSRRITLAEGLHRQAVKLLKLDPDSSSTSSDTLPVHGSLASAAAWRYAQLLSALPKRDTEASAWQELAVRHWQLVHNWSQSSELDKVLGPLDVLKGGKDESPGIIVDLILLRGLPCFTV